MSHSPEISLNSDNDSQDDNDIIVLSDGIELEDSGKSINSNNHFITDPKIDSELIIAEESAASIKHNMQGESEKDQGSDHHEYSDIVHARYVFVFNSSSII